jgi:hypothetical protein
MIAVRRLIIGCLYVTDEVLWPLQCKRDHPVLTSAPCFVGLSGPLEVGVGPPKLVEQDGEFSGDGDARAFGALGYPGTLSYIELQ